MRYVKIFFLTSQHVFNYKGRVFIWFLMALANPLLLFIFWQGVTRLHGNHIPGWSLSTITSYYLLFTAADSFLTTHIEEDISREDIGKGQLAMYLLKPMSYFWKKFTEEFPYRILQGCFAIACIILFTLVFHVFQISNSPLIIVLSMCLSVLALFLSFIFKMIFGLSSIWIIDTDGLFQLYEVVKFLIAGFILPLYLLPPIISYIGYILPFSYMIYFPVIAFQGKLSVPAIVLIMFIQLFWILTFSIIYRYMWKKGVISYTGVGQ